MKGQLVVGAVLIALATVGVAEARTLNKETGARNARLELSDYADYRCNQMSDCDYAGYPDISRYSCRWYARREALRCTGGLDLWMEGYSRYETLRCTATVYVRLGRNTRIRDWECV